MSDSLRFEVLGPVRAWRNGAEISLGSPGQRGLLAFLLLRAGRAVSRSEIIQALWDQEPPGGAAGIIHHYVAGLRKVLEPGRRVRSKPNLLIHVGGAYLIRIERLQLDLFVVQDQLRQARDLRGAERPAESLQVLDAALATWKGAPLTGIRSPFVAQESARLTELQMMVTEERLETMLGLGHDGDTVAELSALVHEYPLRERLRALLMQALYRSGRQAEALQLFHQTRRTLIEELGVEPSRDLQRLNERILARDSSLLLPAETVSSTSMSDGIRLAGPPAEPIAATAISGRPVIPAQLPHDLPNFAGREWHLGAMNALVERSADPARSKSQLIVIDGPAGVGKTALAIHFAHLTANRFPDGQIYVDLQGFHPTKPPLSADDALDYALRSLGVDPSLLPADLNTKSALYRSITAGKRLLVVLDDAASAEQTRHLLPGLADFLTVITSRRQLRDLIARDGAERVYLPPFSSDEATALLSSLTGSLADADPIALAEIARLCGYLPLALRIAAERIITRPRAKMTDLIWEFARGYPRLDMFDLDDTAARGVRAAFRRSYQWLPPSAAEMFRTLGHQAEREFSLSAAASLGQVTMPTARRVLDALTQVHLVDEVAYEQYRIPALVHHYATELALQSSATLSNASLRERLIA